MGWVILFRHVKQIVYICIMKTNNDVNRNDWLRPSIGDRIWLVIEQLGVFSMFGIAVLLISRMIGFPILTVILKVILFPFLP